MKTKTIEFKHTSPDSIPSITPWATPAKSSYKDLIIKPEFASRRFQFPLGSTWLRVIPALKDSTKESYLGVHALQYKGGRHCHPRTISSSDGRSVFDRGYSWFLNNEKESLFSKELKTGHRFLTDPLVLFWMVTEVEGKSVTRLLLASGYDGSRGGTPGLGHQIWALSKDVDEDGIPLGDPADPDLGVQICVTKKQVPGAKYPSYAVKRGRVPAPINEIFASMDEEEIDVLTPLEHVVYIPTEEEEWSLLANVIDPDKISEIRDSVS